MRRSYIRSMDQAVVWGCRQRGGAQLVIAVTPATDSEAVCAHGCKDGAGCKQVDIVIGFVPCIADMLCCQKACKSWCLELCGVALVTVY
jgi:hypothetical protein